MAHIKILILQIHFCTALNLDEKFKSNKFDIFLF
jgi:hypothetical protein